ncbi:MAG TPA: response regulator [Fimbriimonas sp.]|nr:response regulator [Fimbriimonas sp.]
MQETAEETQPAQATILVVDDKPSNTLALEALLEPLGGQVVSASSGREALRYLLRNEVAVILMDVQMPDMDGYETASLIRERPRTQYTPIIFITAVNTDERQAFQGYSVGAVDYITKPFNPDILLSKVGVFVQLYRKEKQLRDQATKLHRAEMDALELKQRERERELEQEKIRAVNRLLEEKVQERTAELEAFCYSVSHDLRAPLRGIHVSASILEQELGSQVDEELRNALGRVKGAAKKMDELISALLSLSRVTRSELQSTGVDLSKLAATVAEEIRSADPERTVSVEIQPDMIANGDQELIRSMLYNLIGNAWKFTANQPNGHISIGISSPVDGRQVFFVKDNGAGFDQRYVHKLFQPFERLHSADEYPGSGVGLATVQRIVRKHGGNVWAEGEEGKGAQFFFTL